VSGGAGEEDAERRASPLPILDPCVPALEPSEVGDERKPNPNSWGVTRCLGTTEEASEALASQLAKAYRRKYIISRKARLL
jgi:hypothetical protein